MNADDQPFSMHDLMELEVVDRDLYRGRNEPATTDRLTLFGGQVAAQALMAAGLTVPEGRFPHSLHGYFLRPGVRKHPVIFHVERDRDGRSFSARRVRAMQDGAVIFDLTASFQVDEDGGSFAAPMRTDIEPPEACPPEPYQTSFPQVDARVVAPALLDGDGKLRSSTMWMRTIAPLGEDRLLQCAALVYLSDIGTGFMSHEIPGLPRGGPSIDHAMWFRTPIRADEWVLFHTWPLMAGGGRGLYVGSMHQHDGTLGATMTQEALMRLPA
jgi:acyl-CoA thioesterase-2